MQSYVPKGEMEGIDREEKERGEGKGEERLRLQQPSPQPLRLPLSSLPLLLSSKSPSSAPLRHVRRVQRRIPPSDARTLLLIRLQGLVHPQPADAAAGGVVLTVTVVGVRRVEGRGVLRERVVVHPSCSSSADPAESESESSTGWRRRSVPHPSSRDATVRERRLSESRSRVEEVSPSGRSRRVNDNAELRLRRR
jgi:hypothetical protein